MAKFNITEVKTKKDIRQWLEFPSKLYKKDPYYVRPLNNEVENVFDRSKNKLFRHGDATRFLLKDERGNIVGRIAAFYDEKTSNTYNKTFIDVATFIDNSDPIQVVITSKGGDVFKNGTGSTVLTAVCYQAGVEVDTDGKGTYTWTKYNKDGAIDTAWGTSGKKTGKTLSVSSSDVATIRNIFIIINYKVC